MTLAGPKFLEKSLHFSDQLLDCVAPKCIKRLT